MEAETIPSWGVDKGARGLELTFYDKLAGQTEKKVDVASLPNRNRYVWIKAVIDFEGKGYLEYSLDGKKYHATGETFQLKWGSYRGARIGVFTYNDADTGGYVDFDFVEYRDITPKKDAAPQK